MTQASVPSSPLRPVALVSGGARRIGRPIALELAAHGHDIALHVREAGSSTHISVRCG